MRVVDLRAHRPAGVLAVDGSTPRLTWRLAPTCPRARQLGYEVQGVRVLDVRRSSCHDGRRPREQPDRRGSARWWSAQPRSRGTSAFAFSPITAAATGASPMTLEAGLLSADDWHGSAITLADDPGRTRSAPAPLLRTEFTLDQPPVRARLYVTSLGVHALFLNGERVDDGHLAPGWTTYREAAAGGRLRRDRAPPSRAATRSERSSATGGIAVDWGGCRAKTDAGTARTSASSSSSRSG